MDQPNRTAKAFLEVTFPDFGRSVIYMDPHNTLLRYKYEFPANLVVGYANYATKVHHLKS